MLFFNVFKKYVHILAASRMSVSIYTYISSYDTLICTSYDTRYFRTNIHISIFRCMFMKRYTRYYKNRNTLQL